MVQAWPGTEALAVPARQPVTGGPPGVQRPGSQGLLFHAWPSALSWPGVATVPEGPLVGMGHTHLFIPA